MFSLLNAHFFMEYITESFLLTTAPYQQSIRYMDVNKEKYTIFKACKVHFVMHIL